MHTLYSKDDSVSCLCTSNSMYHTFESATNTRFIIVTAPGIEPMTTQLHQLYDIFVQCFALNPMQERNDAVKCVMLDKMVDQFVAKIAS